ncbi:chloride channel protein [soil metagenome]
MSQPESTPPSAPKPRRALKPTQPIAFATEVAVRGYQLWLHTKARFTPTEQQRLFGLTIAIGGICGLVAVAFHESIRAVESLTIDRAYASSGNSWIAWVIVVPTCGALLAGILLYYVPGARGSGVPQVKVAYATKRMTLRARDSIGKFVIGAIQIGSGSSLGREGPTVQICSGVAKGLGRFAGISAQNLKLLLPVGAAAGIAAAFNAPIAAVTFTIEEIVGKLDQTLLSGVIVAAALAAVVERSVLGEHPVFTIPQAYGLDHASSLIVYAALGIAAALVSVAFTESLLALRRRFAGASRLPIWMRPAFGGLATGILGACVMLVVHVGGITGGGYEGLAGALSGKFTIEVLLVLGAAKLVATVLSYASGGAGGIFAPSLFIGAMLGGAFGVIDVEVLGHSHSSVGAFALVGMGAVFAGVVRAPITSVLIILEMTAGYGLTLPLMISNMAAYGLARRLRHMPIYDALLAQDGVDLHPKKSALDPLEGLTIERVKLDLGPHVTFSPGHTSRELMDLADTAGRQEVFPVLDEQQHLIGILTLEDLAMIAAEPDLDALIRAVDIMRTVVAIPQGMLVSEALDIIMSAGVRELPVVDAELRVLGMLDEAALAREYMRARATNRPGDSTASGVFVVSLPEDH